MIGRCAVFCGARMHANIAALSSSVPVVALSYSHKTPGIMAACGLADFVVPAAEITAERLEALIDQAVSERDALSTRLAEAVGDMRRQARRNFEILARLASHGQDGGA